MDKGGKDCKENCAEDIPEVGKNSEEPCIELLINTMVGLTDTGNVKPRGYVRTKVVTSLMNSGATHNFIASDLVDEVQLAIYGTGN